MKNYTGSIFVTVLSLLLVGGFILWIEVDIISLSILTEEDGFFENATALNFLVSGVFFLIVLSKSNFLKEKGTRWAYLITGSWALLMFVFVGEEISWGQRIIGIETPQFLSEINTQKELNIHNIEIVDEFLGGKYRYLSIMMLATGLILPLVSLTEWGRRMFQFSAFPVSPLRYAWLFVGAYLYDKYYHFWPPESLIVDGKLGFEIPSTEIREFIFSIAMVCFSLHGVARPESLYRAE